MGFPVMPAEPEKPIFLACKDTGRPLNECQIENTKYYKPRREYGKKCFCVDPLSGKSTKTDCKSICRGEKGNTCKEARERGLEMLNGPFMIADYSPPECQSENETLYKIKKWSWNGGCSCLNPFTGQSIMHSNFMEQCREPDFCPTFE